MNRISPLCKHSARGDLGRSEFAAFVKIEDPVSSVPEASLKLDVQVSCLKSKKTSLGFLKRRISEQ